VHDRHRPRQPCVRGGDRCCPETGRQCGRTRIPPWVINGEQFVAIVSGPSPGSRSRLVNTPELKEQRNALVLYVFGL
jgi:hypothetical protein